jgi:hypothetical protein
MMADNPGWVPLQTMDPRYFGVVNRRRQIRQIVTEPVYFPSVAPLRMIAESLTTRFFNTLFSSLRALMASSVGVSSSGYRGQSVGNGRWQ